MAIIQRQADALEDSAQSSDIAIYAGIGGAALSGFGGALIGAYLSRKSAREQWKETKDEMAKDRKVSEDSLNISKETMRQQLRPWIGRSDIKLDGAFIQDGSYVNLTQVPNLLNSGRPIDTLVFKFMLQNYGSLPAMHCSTGYRTITTDHPAAIPDRSELERVKMYQDIVVMPGEQLPVDIKVKPEQLQHRLFVVGRVKYSYPGGDGFYDYMTEFDGVAWTPKYNEAG